MKDWALAFFAASCVAALVGAIVYVAGTVLVFMYG